MKQLMTLLLTIFISTMAFAAGSLICIAEGDRVLNGFKPTDGDQVIITKVKRGTEEYDLRNGARISAITVAKRDQNEIIYLKVVDT